MSLLISMAATALVLSPVFVLAGWVRTAQVRTVRASFNGTARRAH